MESTTSLEEIVSMTDQFEVGQRIEDPRRRRSPRDTELELAMRRFFELSAADQLRAFEQMRDFLGTGAPSLAKVDLQIEQRAESLAALARVAEHLGLNGAAPTTEQFDQVARELKLGWTSGKVIRVWARWRFACDALRGGRTRLTAAQLSLRHRSIGLTRKHEDYLTAVRLWLATSPPLVRRVDYEAWAREYNDALKDGELPVLGSKAITLALTLSWKDIVRVGRGEIGFDQAEKRSISERADWTSGPHDLVSQRSGAQILKINAGNFQWASRKPGFPTPIVIFARKRNTRAWLREDLEVYCETGKAPKRKLNGLRHLYYSTVELAPLVGVKPGTLSEAGRASPTPPPTGRVGSTLYWLKRDADRWIRDNKALVERRLARGPITTRPAAAKTASKRR